MDFQELEVLFWKRKNYRNSSFDSNSPPQGHQLFINICFNILILKSRKKSDPPLSKSVPYIQNCSQKLLKYKVVDGTKLSKKENAEEKKKIPPSMLSPSSKKRKPPASA